MLSGLNTGKYGPEITPYLVTFHAVKMVEEIGQQSKIFNDFNDPNDACECIMD